MIDWILGFTFNSTLGLLLYWVPAALCLYGYIVRTVANYRRDVATRAKAKDGHSIYIPTDTLGDIIGRGLATIIPVVNLFAAVFDVAPEVFGRLFDWIGRVFSQPLVPKRDANA